MLINNVSLIKSFNCFINKHKCGKDGITHTTYNGGRYCFSGKNYEKFIKKYVEMVTFNNKLHFIERPNKNGVTYLFIDVDIDHKGGERLYKQNNIKKIIKMTNNILNNIFNITNNQLTTIVTEKSKPSNKNGDIYKDGFHIYYPYLPLEEKYRYYITDCLINKVVAKKLMKNIPYINDAKKIIDTTIIRSNGITMIGSKKIGGQEYDLTHIYNSDVNDVNVDGYDKEELIYLLSNQRFDMEATVEAKSDSKLHLDIDKTYAEYNKGNVKNNKSNSNKSNSNNSNKSNSNKNSKNNRKINSKYNNKENVMHERDIKLVRMLCKILSEDRAYDYYKWKFVGFTLRAIDDSLFDDFVGFSKKVCG